MKVGIACNVTGATGTGSITIQCASKFYRLLNNNKEMSQAAAYFIVSVRTGLLPMPR